MVVEPAFTAVTFPLPSTVATPVSEDFQLTALLVALSGDTVAVKVSEPPSTRFNEDLFKDTPVTDTVVGAGGVGGRGSSFGPQPKNKPEIIASDINADKVWVMVFFISREILSVLIISWDEGL
jgi:hypothetical protein